MGKWTTKDDKAIQDKKDEWHLGKKMQKKNEKKKLK